MVRRKFGNSPVEVSAVSLGCWIFGVDWWGHRTQEDCDRLCSFAFDQGVTFFDNGDAYGNGRAEELFGKWLKGRDRSTVEIGSKFGYDWYNDPGEEGSHRERKQDFSPAFLRKALEQSLRRLGVETIDLYMAHNIKLPQFRDDLFGELEKVKDEGKIKVWGVSLGPAIGWREEGFKAMGDHDAKAVQTVYNLFEQHPGKEFCEMARATKAGILARVQDNSGVLKDVIKADTELAANDHRKFRDENCCADASLFDEIRKGKVPEPPHLSDGYTEVYQRGEFTIDTPAPPFGISVDIRRTFVPHKLDPRISDQRQLGAIVAFSFQER